jgi:hypothetical protein
LALEGAGSPETIKDLFSSSGYLRYTTHYFCIAPRYHRLSFTPLRNLAYLAWYFPYDPLFQFIFTFFGFSVPSLFPFLSDYQPCHSVMKYYDPACRRCRE